MRKIVACGGAVLALRVAARRSAGAWLPRRTYWRSGSALACAALLAALAGGSPAPAAQDPAAGDIRDIRIGAKVTELSQQSFGGFRCGASDDELAGWGDYRRCPVDKAGRREIRFEMVQTNERLASLNDRWQGTKIAGHPVLLSLFVGEGGEVEAIRMTTDPEARFYLKKKAYLFGLRVRERYGEEGWTCTDRPKQDGESEVGGLFVRQTCEKVSGGRRLLLETNLYRAVGQSGREFESSARFEIMRADR